MTADYKKEQRNARDRARYAAKKGYGIQERKVKKETHIAFTCGHTLEKFATVHKFLATQGFADIQTRTAVDRAAFDCLVTIIGDNFPQCLFTDFFAANEYLERVGMISPKLVNRAESGRIKAMQVRGQFVERNPTYAGGYHQAMPARGKQLADMTVYELMAESMDAKDEGDWERYAKLYNQIMIGKEGYPRTAVEYQREHAPGSLPVEDVREIDRPSGSDLMEPGQQAPDQLAGMKDIFGKPNLIGGEDE